MDERDYYLKRARKSGKENDWSSYRQLRNIVTRIIRYNKATYMRSILWENIDGPAKFWNQIKRCFPIKSRNHRASIVFEIEGVPMDRQHQIANGFCTLLAILEENYGTL